MASSNHNFGTTVAAASNLEAASMKATTRRLKKNMYQRQKQATYRRQDKLEIAFQRERVVVLEEMLDQARARLRGVVTSKSSSSSILSWEDIALALREGEDAAVARNGQLRHQVHRGRAVIEDLKVWLFTRIPVRITPPLHHRQVCSVPFLTCLDQAYPISSIWRNVGLVQHADTRRIGVDWITKQLAHNATHAFQQYGFPSPESGETIDDYVYFYDGDGLVAVQRIQYIVNQPLEVFYKVVTSDTFLGHENLNSHDPPLNPAIHHRIHDTHNNTIRTNFVSRVAHIGLNCISFVGQHVNNDELFPTTNLQRHRVMM
ncbi:hypothetical protein B5M09_010651 [Aphanomyces astaci]|uniref:BZIP domain-containing protein n=1 Tax=Aphanomyces astaci TaxID=112090 RepID=A0A425DIY4_APHAT|nr:hypothetical protein B5M09_010651 [Aphanomyces astaci]